MSDQADILRDLMQRRQREAVVPKPPIRRTARTIAITSGKGGVGKSNIALNLAIALAKMDASVCILDANSGLGNIDLLCGLNGYWNLSHVVTGTRSLKDIVLKGPCGINVIPGASGLADVADDSESVQTEILHQMQHLERAHDFLIIDTGTGIHQHVRQFAIAADVVLIVTTAEPTSIADAYATIKAFAGGDSAQLKTLVNRADSPQQARAILNRLQQTARIFLRTEVGSIGFIPNEQSVVQAVAKRTPFILDSPQAGASQAVHQLAQRLKNLTDAQHDRGSFFARLWNRLTRKAA